MLRLNIRPRPRVIRYNRATLTGKIHVTATTLERGDKGQELDSEIIANKGELGVGAELHLFYLDSTSRYVPSHNSRRAGIKDSRLPARNWRLPRSECSAIHWNITHTLSGFFSERSLRVRIPGSSREMRGVASRNFRASSPRRRGTPSRMRRHEENRHARDYSTPFRTGPRCLSDLRWSPAR